MKGRGGKGKDGSPRAQMTLDASLGEREGGEGEKKGRERGREGDREGEKRHLGVDDVGQIPAVDLLLEGPHADLGRDAVASAWQTRAKAAGKESRGSE